VIESENTNESESLPSTYATLASDFNSLFLSFGQSTF